VARSLAGLIVENQTANVKSYQTNSQNNINNGIPEWEMKGMTRDNYIIFRKSGLTDEEWKIKNKEYDLIKKNALFEGLNILSNQCSAYQFLLILFVSFV